MSEKPKYIAGVRENPDGGFDYSHAVIPLESNKEKTTKPRRVEDLEERKKKIAELWRISEENKKARMGKIRKEHGIDDEREGLQEKAAELVLQDGGVRIHTSIDQNLSPKRNAGFQNLESRIKDYGNPSSVQGKIEAQFLSQNDLQRGTRLREALANSQISEIIDIRQETKPIYEENIIPGKKGILGIGKTPDRIEELPTGDHEPVLHLEHVEGGKNEPAVRFTYLVRSDEWRDYSGRTGQMLSVEIILPESTAEEVKKILEKDPTTMRKIVERVMKEKFLKDPSAWETPQGAGDSLCPPYDKWDKESKGIYIQQEGMSPGFHEEALHKVGK